MDEGVLVEVYVPAAMQTIMMYLPFFQSVTLIQEALFPMLEQITNEAFVYTSQTMLYSERMHMPLDKTALLKDTGIQYADRIIVL